MKYLHSAALAAVLLSISLSLTYGQSGQRALNNSLAQYQAILLYDSDPGITYDDQTRAALANAFARLQSMAFDKKLKVSYSSAYANRTLPLDFLRTGRDNILLAAPTFSYRTVGTVIKRMEVTTTIIFTDLYTLQPVLKKESVTRNKDWSFAFSEGLIECFRELMDSHPGYDFRQTRAFKNTFISTPFFEVLMSEYRQSKSPHTLEGLWRIENDSHFGKFEIFVQSGKNTAGAEILIGTVVNPLYSDRVPNQVFLSFDVVEKNGYRPGIISEENLALNYIAKVRHVEGALVVEIEDLLWKALPNVLLRRPPSWAAMQNPNTIGTTQPPSQPPMKVEDAASARPQSSGSGFLVSRSGIVATNYHVIEGFNRIYVTLPAVGRMLEADVLAADTRNDLVLLKIRDFPSGIFPDFLPFAIRSSSGLQVGSKVFTIGYPLSDFLGVKPKFTDGTVSAITGYLDDPRLIQMNASIQPGSSGGPLFNTAGEIVGVVVASANSKLFYEATGVIPQNVNFAVKSDYLLSLLYSEQIRPDQEFTAMKWSGSMEDLVDLLTRFSAKITVE